MHFDTPVHSAYTSQLTQRPVTPEKLSGGKSYSNADQVACMAREEEAAHPSCFQVVASL